MITRIAEEVGRTPAQVTLRWHIQRGDIIFPKSSTPERMAENFALFDFELDDDAVKAISAPGQGRGRSHRPQPGHVRLHPRLSTAPATPAPTRLLVTRGSCC